MSAYGTETSSTQAGMTPVAARNVPPDHERAPHQEDARLAEAVVLEPDRRRDVEHRDEEAGEREDEDRAGRARAVRYEHDRRRR